MHKREHECIDGGPDGRQGKVNDERRTRKKGKKKLKGLNSCKLGTGHVLQWEHVAYI